MRPTGAGAVLALILLMSPSAFAQVPQNQTSVAKMVRVFVSCEGCDAGLKTDVTFVEYATTREGAELEVIITPGTLPSGERAWQFTFTGRERFAGEERKLALTLPANATPDDVKAGLARVFKFGLAEYAVRSDAGPHMDVSFRQPQAPGQEQAGAAAADRAKDPWNYWVFRVGASGDRYGERSQSSSYMSTSVSANRTTEQWKVRVSGYRSRNTSRFMIDETQTIRTKEGNWSTDSLIVKSLGPHWSAGVTGGVTSSTYSNQHLVVSFTPAVEYDIFPYSESSARSLTIQYAVGVSHYEYSEITIYDKLDETMPKHSATVSLGLRQPWGSAGASFNFWQSLSSPKLNRVSLDGNVSVRLFKGFNVNGSASFSRIRDQFYLEKSDATEEEILLRLRQLATGHRYYFNFGVSYSFGSLSNATVNPRFGG